MTSLRAVLLGIMTLCRSSSSQFDRITVSFLAPPNRPPRTNVYSSTSFLDEQTDAPSDDGIAVHIDVAPSSTVDKTWTDDIIAIGNTTANAAQRAYEKDMIIRWSDCMTCC